MPSRLRIYPLHLVGELSVQLDGIDGLDVEQNRTQRITKQYVAFDTFEGDIGAGLGCRLWICGTQPNDACRDVDTHLPDVVVVNRRDHSCAASSFQERTTVSLVALFRGLTSYYVESRRGATRRRGLVG